MAGPANHSQPLPDGPCGLWINGPMFGSAPCIFPITIWVGRTRLCALRQPPLALDLSVGQRTLKVAGAISHEGCGNVSGKSDRDTAQAHGAYCGCVRVDGIVG